MVKILTEKELKDIALGYNWNHLMGYTDFVKSNNNISFQTGHEMYELINERYITYVYEED